MRVLCIDASPGFRSGELPPFNEGDILNAEQSPYHPDDYLIENNGMCGWHKKRFLPLQDEHCEIEIEIEIEEMELEMV